MHGLWEGMIETSLSSTIICIGLGPLWEAFAIHNTREGEEQTTGDAPRADAYAVFPTFFIILGYFIRKIR